MNDALKAYLDAYPFHHETTEQWPVQGKMRVRLSLGTTLPPSHVSSSVLAIVLDAERRVLFLHPSTPTGSIMNVLIGGRPESGEIPEATAMREVGEETGWRIEPIRMIGFRHFFHLEPHVEASDRPYPDFIQPVFAARALAFDPNLLIPSDQVPAEFIDLATVERMTDPRQLPLLRETVKVLDLA